MSEEERAEAKRAAANTALLIKVIQATSWIVAGVVFTCLVNDTLQGLKQDPYKSNLKGLLGR